MKNISNIVMLSLSMGLSFSLSATRAPQGRKLIWTQGELEQFYKKPALIKISAQIKDCTKTLAQKLAYITAFMDSSEFNSMPKKEQVQIRNIHLNVSSWYDYEKQMQQLGIPINWDVIKK